MTPRTAAAVLGLLALVAAGCGGDDGGAAVSRTTAEPVATTTSTTVVVTTTTAPPPAPVPGGTLDVVVVGDSVMHDASAGIEAALAATGAATARPASAFGLGFSEDAAVPLAGSVADVLDGGPVEQVVVMVGSWDHLAAVRDPDAYARVVVSTLRTLARGGRGVLVLGEPPSDPAKGEEPARRAVNAALVDAVGQVPGARFLSTDAVIGDADGRFVRADGADLLRKPDGRHVCPEGAERFGRAVVDALSEVWRLPPPAPGWEDGAWRFERRYDDPPGACTA